ncbi:MAG: hypothetical protein WCJ54_05055 [Actinomycetota bacterium]
MSDFEKGKFVKVGNDIGVIVSLENENNTPEGHLGIWYGELTDEGTPKYRTVPKEYCFLVQKTEIYH